MKVTFLGTGTSSGIPMIGCPCAVCSSPDTNDKRLRASILIEWNEFKIAVDAGPDFRQQMLRAGVKKLDAILFTHAHKDHTAGLDDVRAFNFFSGKPMDIYATVEVQESLKNEFFYAFDKMHDYPGLPKFTLHTIRNEEFMMEDLKIIPVEVSHYKLPVLGFRFNDFTYITDASFISEDELKKVYGTRILVLNALRHERHISHFTLKEAIDLAGRIGAEKTYFTHISHQMGLHSEISASLPHNMFLANDELKLDI